jgi:hypothetical protein
MKNITLLSAIGVTALSIILSAVANVNYVSSMLQKYGLGYAFGSAIGTFLIILLIALIVEKIVLSSRKKPRTE